MASILRVIIQKDYLISVLNNQALEIDSSWKEGEPKYVTKPEKGKLKTTGFSICLSDADFDEFERQKQESIDYLTQNSAALKALLLNHKVIKAKIDFGIYMRDVIVQSDYFSPQLIKLCGELNLGIELSQYPNDEEDEN